MKPFPELTCLGRVRSMRELARVALAAYGIVDSALGFTHNRTSARQELVGFAKSQSLHNLTWTYVYAPHVGAALINKAL